MSYQLVTKVLEGMSNSLSKDQLEKLHDVLIKELSAISSSDVIDDTKLVDSFITAKRIEGCSNNTLRYYSSTLKNVFTSIGKSIRSVETNDIRLYLSDY